MRRTASSLGFLLHNTIADLLRREKVAIQYLTLQWPDLLESNFAKYSAPVRLIRSGNSGKKTTLLIYSTPETTLMLQMLSEQILEKINQLPGLSYITGIKFTTRVPGK